MTRALLLRGRRRVGKSRLVDLFCERAQVPYVVHQATRGEDAHRERAPFLDEVRHSSLPDNALLTGVTTVTEWDTALRQPLTSRRHDDPASDTQSATRCGQGHGPLARSAVSSGAL